LLNDPVTNFSVTPEHRVYYESNSATRNGYESGRIVLAKDFKPSTDKRFIKGGTVVSKGIAELSDDEIRLIVATQADGHLALDCSAIAFSFVKERKISRMKEILDRMQAKYTVSTHSRKGRDEVTLRLASGPLTVKIRKYLSSKKVPLNSLLAMSARQMQVFIDEVVYWDGTLRKNKDVVLDTTCKETVNFVQTLCSLTNRKCMVSKYLRNTNFGDCIVYRAYLSVAALGNNATGSSELQEEDYEGYIGCVAVPSGLVLVKRNGVIIVSGNTLNAKKLGIDRNSAKSFSYAAIYGAQPKKLSKMLGISEEEGKRLFNEYWEAVPALKELKQKVEKEWETSGKKNILGLDGRLLNTRSKHSLINVLFQSGGAIAAKWSSVKIAEYLEEHDLLGNPLENSKNDEKVWFMIAYHDECQFAVHPKLMKTKVFQSDEEAKDFTKDNAGCSAVGHGTRGAYVGLKTLPVQAIEEGIELANKQLSLHVQLGFEWIPGLTWGQCH